MLLKYERTHKMAHMTEAKIVQQEQFDKDVYEANRGMFEHVFLRCIEKAKAGEDVAKDVKVLLDSYNNTSESCQRLVGKLRRAEAGEI